MFRSIAFALAMGMFLALGCRGKAEVDSDSRDDENFLRCAEPKSDDAVETFHLPPLTVERKGYDVDVHGIKRGLVVLGVIAGIFEPSEPNLANLQQFLEHFKAAGVQAILVVGGVGAQGEQVEAVVDFLSRAPVPILLVPGALEQFDIFRAIIARARKTTPQVLDMTQTRRVRIGHITLLSLPGYYKPFYLRAGKSGCSVTEDDIGKTLDLRESKRTNILVSPTPPRGFGPHSVDRSRVGVNAGDEILASLLEKFGVQFGIFGYFYESGGHGTLRDGVTAVSEGIWQDSLYLQAGSVEALPLRTVGEGWSVGMAQIVEFSGSRARYRTLRAGAADTLGR